MHCSCLLQIRAECLLQSDWLKIEVLQINILKIIFSGVGFEGLYPRLKLVAMDTNGKKSTQATNVFYYFGIDKVYKA